MRHLHATSQGGKRTLGVPYRCLCSASRLRSPINTFATQRSAAPTDIPTMLATIWGPIFIVAPVRASSYVPVHVRRAFRMCAPRAPDACKRVLLVPLASRSGRSSTGYRHRQTYRTLG